MNKLLLFLLSTTILAACNSNKSTTSEMTGAKTDKQELPIQEKIELQNNGKYVIKGKVSNPNEGSVRLGHLQLSTSPGVPPQMIPLQDVALDKNNEFIMMGTTTERKVVYLYPTTTEDAAFIVLDGGEMDMEIDAQNPMALKINGSPATADLNKFLRENQSIQQAYFDIQNQLTRARMQGKQATEMKQLEARLESTRQSADQFTVKYVNNTPHLINAAFATQVLDPVAHWQLVDNVIQRMQGAYPGHSFIPVMQNHIREQKKWLGQQAPEIDLPNPDGKNILLSSLKGKYVLLDFWASWCGPCRAENPNVVKLYNKYKNDGFTVYSVSLDRPGMKQAWLEAIKKDNLIWPNHVSDLKGWQSAVTKPYEVAGIPKTFLIDPEGKIIAMNLRGAALEKKLQELFNG